MFAINEDKSLFNLGNWGVMNIPANSFVPGIIINNADIQSKAKNKFVYQKDVSEWDFAKAVCQGTTEPCPEWDVIHYEASATYYGLENLTESEQENAEVIEDVFFSNSTIYVIATAQPLDRIYIRVKGV